MGALEPHPTGDKFTIAPPPPQAHPERSPIPPLTPGAAMDNEQSTLSKWTREQIRSAPVGAVFVFPHSHSTEKYRAWKHETGRRDLAFTHLSYIKGAPAVYRDCVLVFDHFCWSDYPADFEKAMAGLARVRSESPPPEEHRQTGRTTRQIMTAPREAVYVFPNASQVDDAKTDWVKRTGRTDITFVVLQYVSHSPAEFAGRPVVFDHECWEWLPAEFGDVVIALARTNGGSRRSVVYPWSDLDAIQLTAAIVEDRGCFAPIRASLSGSLVGLFDPVRSDALRAACGICSSADDAVRSAGIFRQFLAGEKVDV